MITGPCMVTVGIQPQITPSPDVCLFKGFIVISKHSMHANMYFNALLRPVIVSVSLDERMVREQVPVHRQVMARKVLKSQETMHKAQVWRDLHPECYIQYIEKKWRSELGPPVCHKRPRVVPKYNLPISLKNSRPVHITA